MRGMNATLLDVNVIHSTSYFEFFKNSGLTPAASSLQKLLLELKVINDLSKMNNYISEAISALFYEFLVLDTGQTHTETHIYNPPVISHHHYLLSSQWKLAGQ